MKEHLPFLGILLLAFGLRWFGWNWDEGYYLHPDERHVGMVTSALERPDTLREWLDGATSPFTPYQQQIGSYVYGQLPLNLVHLFTVEQGERDLRKIIRAGRLMSALFSTATVALLYGFGLQLVSRRFAELAALLQAAVVLSIQQAHFYTIDSAGTFFATACVGLGLVYSRNRRLPTLILSGATVGLAMACRINLGLLAFWVTGLSLILAIRDRTLRPVLGLALGGGLALLFFQLFHPMAFSGWGLNPRWLEDLRQVHAISRGTLEVPFTLQWVGRIPYVYALQNLLVYSLGIPLGLSAVGGTLFLLWHLRGRFLDWRFFAPFWPLLLVLYHGRIFLHTQRYFLPAVPILALCGAAVLRRIRPLEIGRLVTGAVLVSTLLYAVAFVNMYRDPHPRVAASEWLYEQLPLGGTVLTEHWDDALPLRLDDRSADHGRIRIRQAEVYPRESPEKIRRLLEQIEEADYLVLSSTRASLTLPRMPMRYPVMTRFYQRLNEGHTRSGLREVARFHRAPHLAGWKMDSLRAEEAYRVYDHPRVRIFEKTPVFDVESAFELLTSGIDFEALPDIHYLQAGNSNAGWLTADQLERRQQGAPWRELFSETSLGGRAPVLIWCLVLFALGPVSFPICFVLFPNIRDRGISVARLLGWCLLSWMAWWPSAWEKIAFPRSLLIAGMLLVGLSAALTVVHAAEMRRWLRRNIRMLLGTEGVCWAVFVFFLLLRMAQPELWHPWAGGEKPMDFAYLNAVAGSAVFPPENPWLSGTFINYYYYGFVLVASLIHLTGVLPETAVNLALATFAMMTAGAALGLTRALFPLFRRRQGWRGLGWAGGLSVLLVLFVGNLAQIRELLTGVLRKVPRELYWNASRAIHVPEGEVPPITEFPMFSHLYGDLHAHVMVLPLAMLCLLTSWQLLRKFDLLRWSACALLLGTVWVTNTWDLPIQVAVFVFCCLLPGLHDRRWGVRILGALGGPLMARLLFFPFHLRFESLPLELQPWEGPRSSLLDLFLVHGLFLVPIAGGLILWIRRGGPRPLRAHLLPLALLAGSLFTILFLEFFHLRGDIGRMNVVFKFYYQIWWILALGTSLLLTMFVGRKHLLYSILSAILLICGLTYPVTAIPAKLREGPWTSPAGTLDGMAYQEEAVWNLDGHPVRLADDRAVIRWLREHADPGSVLLEGQRPLYQWGGRISWHTGLPSVLGWDWHMRQQRPWPGGERTVHQRQEDIRRFFSGTDASVLDRYNVSFVILGELERLTYGTEALVRISRLPALSPVFASGSTTVYEVKKGAADGPRSP